MLADCSPSFSSQQWCATETVASRLNGKCFYIHCTLVSTFPRIADSTLRLLTQYIRNGTFLVRSQNEVTNAQDKVCKQCTYLYHKDFVSFWYTHQHTTMAASQDGWNTLCTVSNMITLTSSKPYQKHLIDTQFTRTKKSVSEVAARSVAMVQQGRMTQR